MVPWTLLPCALFFAEAGLGSYSLALAGKNLPQCDDKALIWLKARVIIGLLGVLSSIAALVWPRMLWVALVMALGSAVCNIRLLMLQCPVNNKIFGSNTWPHWLGLIICLVNVAVCSVLLFGKAAWRTATLTRKNLIASRNKRIISNWDRSTTEWTGKLDAQRKLDEQANQNLQASIAQEQRDMNIAAQQRIEEQARSEAELILRQNSEEFERQLQEQQLATTFGGSMGLWGQRPF